MIACLKQDGLGLFSATADQRYTLGEDVFERTHLPSSMIRYKANGQTELWHQDDLTKILFDSSQKAALGNRCFVLYGAAGSGKSELMRWIYRKACQKGKEDYVLRISRTELDPVLIMHKLMLKFNGQGLHPGILGQWQDFQQKPVALANHLVWTALGSMLSRDEEIIPLSYQLRPIIENNLKLNFEQNNHTSTSADVTNQRTPELISMEDLEKIAQQSALPVEIDYYQLRYLLSKELEKTVMGGTGFVEFLKSTSESVYNKYGVRPILIVDDLVQSLNVYASDLLDFFTTLEEGMWDVVVGLTPSSFDNSKVGRELLNRISYLDTFDDRMVKLWMSDEQGLISHVLTEENCVTFAKGYLIEYKRMNGFQCNPSCSQFEQCSVLHEDDYLNQLVPFNSVVLKRLYHSLPMAKGKPRYFVLHMGEMLEKIMAGKASEAFRENLHQDLYVEHSDPTLRSIIEAYAPKDSINSAYFEWNPGIAHLLVGEGKDLPLNQEWEHLKVGSLMSKTAQKKQTETDLGELDPGKIAIRKWLDGEKTNKELLKGVRLGIAYLLREIVHPCDLVPEFTPRQNGTLRWDITTEGSKIPLAFEDLDNFEGITISKELGFSTYSFYYLHLKRGQLREAALEDIFANPYTRVLLRQGEGLKKRISSSLEANLNMPIQQLAFLLYKLAFEFPNPISEMPSAFYDTNNTGGMDYPASLKAQQVRLSEEQLLLVESLFKDWFLFRESIYNASAIEEWKEKCKNTNPFKAIAGIDANLIPPEYKFGQKSFAGNLSSIKDKINEWEGVLDTDAVNDLLEDFQQLLLVEYDLEHPSFYDEMYVSLQSLGQTLGVACPLLPSWKECHQLRVSLYKSCKRFMNTDDELITLDFRQKHELLLTLGSYDENSTYLKLMELIQWFKQIDEQLGLEESKIGKQIQSLGLKAFENMDSTTTSEERYSLHGQLACLLMKAKQIEEMKNRINTLSIAIRYVDESLLNEVHHVNLVLESIRDVSLPFAFDESLNQLIEKCLLYEKSVQSLQQNTSLFLYNKRLKGLETSYEELHNGMLKVNLLALLRHWEEHLSTIHTLVGAIKNDNDISLDFYEGIRSNASYPFSLSTENLANHLSQVIRYTTEKTPSSEQVKELFVKQMDAQHAWVIDALLQNHGREEITISRQRAQQLETFINNFPNIEGKLFARLSVR